MKVSMDVAARFHEIYILLPWNPPSYIRRYLVHIKIASMEINSKYQFNVRDRHGGASPARMIPGGTL